MADKNDKDTVRKIWLAGIGAYGRALSEAKGAVDTVTGKGSDVFDQLVNKGEMLETVGKYKAEELLNRGKEAVPDFDVPDLKMDERIAKMRARLFDRGETGASSEMEARLSALEAKVEMLLVALDLDNAANVAAREASTKKPAAKSTAKTKAKAKPTSKTKMTTKKTVAKKPPAKKA